MKIIKDFDLEGISGGALNETGKRVLIGVGGAILGVLVTTIAAVAIFTRIEKRRVVSISGPVSLDAEASPSKAPIGTNINSNSGVYGAIDYSDINVLSAPCMGLRQNEDSADVEFISPPSYD